MATQAQIDAFVNAINAGFTPDQIQQYAASQANVPAEVQADPSSYGYDYGSNPLGQIPGSSIDAGTRNLAFSPTESYDYRTDPSYLALQRAYDFAASDQQRQTAQQLGNLDVLQPVTEGDIQANQQEALRQADLNAEARGIYQSGERLTNRARIAGDYGRQLSNVQLTGSLQRQNLQSDLAAALARIDRQRADTQTQYATPPLPSAPPGGF